MTVFRRPIIALTLILLAGPLCVFPWGGPFLVCVVLFAAIVIALKPR